MNRWKKIYLSEVYVSKLGNVEGTLEYKKGSKGSFCDLPVDSSFKNVKLKAEGKVVNPTESQLIEIEKLIRVIGSMENLKK